MAFSNRDQEFADDGVFALFCLGCKRAFGIDTERVACDVSLPAALLLELQRRRRTPQSKAQGVARYRAGGDLRNECSPFRAMDGKAGGVFRASNAPPALFAHFQWGPTCNSSTVSSAKTVQISELSEERVTPTMTASPISKSSITKKEPIADYAWALFENTSRTSLVDLPLCSKCWKDCLHNQQKIVDALADEVSILDSLAVLGPEDLALCVRSTANENPAFADDDALRAVEERAELDKEVEQLNKVLEELSEEERGLEIEEENSLRLLNSSRYNNQILQDGEAAVIMSSEQMSNRHKKLESVLLLSEFFIINTNGTFPTINRLRLGRISNPSDASVEFPVTVTEVNCACGYLLHLLSYMCHVNKLAFPSTILRPNGDSSTIELVPGGGKKNEVLDFFITEKFFKWRTFGAACAAFVHCTKDLVGLLQSSVLAKFPAHRDSAGSVSFPPYPIDGDKVGGFSLKSGDTNDENWLKGMRCLLAILDWCISSTTKVSS